MAAAPRYETLDTIASGDFATVYRARDRELGREVAIKQIHQQFLADPRQLERFWREAQLLASLQHPNILTIYDIVRPRGWLIVELMRGSLKRSAETGPIDLDYLRGALLGTLNALHFLHTNGVTHGDVKPSNLLVDAQGRVKLGDFGLARRASNEQGSLLKGTTKYMAPELVSNQFGAIGPASDLYSLGFSAYELMCGPQFESLFPGLATFGRDKQIAWLMWHAAADRQLPEIGRVLEGVPPDLARVIQRLTVKDQSRRYQSAAEVVRDLRAPPGRGLGDLPPLEPPTPPVDKKKRLMRIGAIGAMAFSAIISLFMLLPEKKPVVQHKEEKPVEGVIQSVDADAWRMVLRPAGEETGTPVAFNRGDKFFLNQKEVYLRDLRAADRASIEIYRDSGRRITLVHASRPEPLAGRIKAVDAETGQITVAVPGIDPLAITVPEKLEIVLNGNATHQGKPIKLADLRAGDRVTLQQIRGESGREATELSALREVTAEGAIREVDAKKRELTLAVGQGEAAEVVRLPLAPNCEITLNDRKSLDERLVKIADLEPGYKATVTYDTRILRIDAYHIFGQAGLIQGVQPGAMEVLEEGKERPRTFAVDGECKITLGGDPVTLADLRVGDAVDIKHDSPDAAKPKAGEIAARRPADRTRWAVVVGVQGYEDSMMSRLAYPAADAKLVQEALVKRYRVPVNQALLLVDPTQVVLKQTIAETLERAGAESQVLVYFVGRAWRDDTGAIYLAARDFNHNQVATTGLSLQSLVDGMEECRAKEKILILDAASADPEVSIKREPSTAEMLQTLKGPAGQAALRTVTGIASCSAGQRGGLTKDKKHGILARCLADAFSGQADKNRDTRLEVTELFAFLTESVPSLAMGAEQVQTPKLFLPDNRPPRLSAEAKRAIRAMAAKITAGNVSGAEAKKLYDGSRSLAGNEPEPKLLYGLILLRSKQRNEAMDFFEAFKAERPNELFALQALAWLRFDQRRYSAGLQEMTELVTKVPRPKGEPFPAASAQVFHWSGQLRDYTSAVIEMRGIPEELLRKLDAAVAAQGEEAAKLYEQGRAQTQGVIRDFDQKIADTTDEALKARLRIDRKQALHYAIFPFDVAIESILGGLDR